MSNNAAHYLQRMPTSGPTDALIEACQALGFDVQQNADGSIVRYGECTVATITDHSLEIATATLEHVAPQMPSIAPHQGEAFDRALRRLEWSEICVHEAGHAIAACCLGLHCECVQVDPECEMRLSEEDHPDTLDVHDVPKTEATQQVYAAGAAAEQLIFGRYRPHGAHKDRRDVNGMEVMKVQAVAGQAPDDIDVFDHYVRRIGQQLVKDQIHAVAEALKTKSALSGDDVLSILRHPASSGDQ